MKTFFGLVCIGLVAVIWYLGDQAVHDGQGPLVQLDPVWRLAVLTGAGLIGLALGMFLDAPPPARAFGAVPARFGICTFATWIKVGAVMVAVAAGVGLGTEVFLRSLPPVSRPALFAAGWDAAAATAVMLTLLRRPNRTPAPAA